MVKVVKARWMVLGAVAGLGLGTVAFGGVDDSNNPWGCPITEEARRIWPVGLSCYDANVDGLINFDDFCIIVAGYTGPNVIVMSPLGYQMVIEQPPVEKAVRYVRYRTSQNVTWEMTHELTGVVDYSVLYTLLTGNDSRKEELIPLNLLPLNYISVYAPATFVVQQGSLTDQALRWLAPLNVTLAKTVDVGVAVGCTIGGFASVTPGSEKATISFDFSADPALGVGIECSLATAILMPEQLMGLLPSGVSELLATTKIRPGTGSMGISFDVDVPGVTKEKHLSLGVQFEINGTIHAQVQDTFTLEYLGEVGGGADATLGSYSVSGATVDLADPARSWMHSDTGSCSVSDSSVLSMTTGSPVWSKFLVDLTAPTDTLMVDVDFVSASGAEGMLTVWLDGEQVGTIDERVALSGAQTYMLALPRVFGAGSHELSFYMESYSATASSVDIGHVAFGVMGVPEPGTLVLLGLGGMGLLAGRRRGR